MRELAGQPIIGSGDVVAPYIAGGNIIDRDWWLGALFRLLWVTVTSTAPRLVPRSVLAIVLALLAGPAFALSNACDAVNSDWNGLTIIPAGNGVQGAVNSQYSNFSGNEELFFTAMSTNSSAAELSGSSSAVAAYFGMSDDSATIFEYNAHGTEVSASATVPLAANKNYYPYGYSGSSSGVLQVTMGCRLTTTAVAPSISSQPSSSTVSAGANTTFTVGASNATGYQWQVDSGGGYTNIANGGVYSGATTATLTITGATAGMSGYAYRVVATGAATPNATSNGVLLTVNSPPSISSQPSSSTVSAGANTTFTVGASNATGYQWQVDNGSGYTNVANGGVYSGATTATLTITGATAGMSGYAYRVVATGAATPNATTNGVLLTVNSPPSISSQPSSSTVSAGANTTFTVGASNATGYQWQVDTGSGYTNIANGGVYSGATTATLTITGATAGMSGYAYRVVATGAATPNATSNGVLLTVNSVPSPVITSISPTSGPISGGTSVTISGTGFSTAASTGAVKFGSTTATYTIDSSTAITATSPAGSAGVVDVTVTTTSGTSVTGTSDRFTYVAALSTDATLSGLTLSSGTLSPSFASGTIGYTASVANGTAWITVSPVKSNANAGIKVNNVTVTGSSSGQITLAVGDNMVTVDVLAEDGTTTKTYSVTVFREPATLTLSPANGSFFSLQTGQSLSQQFSANGGIGPYTFAVATSGNPLPAGYSFTSAGLLSGAATAVGNADVDITVTDSGSRTATNTYNFRITAGSITFAPGAGSTLTAGTVGTVYNATVSAAGGTGPYTYATTGSLPPGITVGTSGAVSGTPTTAGTYNFSVTASDSASPANTGTAAYTLVIAPAPTVTFSFSPSAGSLTAGTAGTSYSGTIAASGGTGPYTYATTGSLPSGVTVGTNGAVSGTPTTAGTYNFSVTASDSASPANTGTAAYTLVIAPAPTVTFSFSPSAGSLTAGTAGTSYSGTIAASGGTGPYTYATTGSLPSGVTVGTNGAVSGTPTTAGTYNFSVTATDSASPANTGTVAYTLVIAPAPVVTFTFSPSAGADLTQAMPGEDYNAAIAATGGTGMLVYSLASGDLPSGMVLNVSTGALTGPLAADAEVKSYAFTIGVRDSLGATASASYRLTVVPRTVTAADKTLDVSAGSTPPDVRLDRGATGGPFFSAVVAFVEPASAGTAAIVQGDYAAASVSLPVGWYLRFTPNPAFSGTAHVGYRLLSSLGTSNTGNVVYNIGLNVQQVASDIDNLVRDFTSARQSLIISTIKVPGLLERRRMESATDPITARMAPNGDGMVMNFSSSLVQMRAAGNTASKAIDGVIKQDQMVLSPFNIWIDGSVMMHSRDENDGRWGNFAMLSAGADYMLTDKALVGLSFHLDHMTDPTDEDAELTGNGWLVGPYASFEIGRGVYFDTSLLYGGSTNSIDTAFFDGNFDSSRWMFDTSITGQWKMDEDTRLTPKLRAVYFSEKVDDYSVSNSLGDTIAIDGFTEEQFRISLGAEIERDFILDNGLTLTPSLGATAGVSALDDTSMFGSVSAGLSLSDVKNWTFNFDMLLNFDKDGERSVGAKSSVAAKF